MRKTFVIILSCVMIVAAAGCSADSGKNTSTSEGRVQQSSVSSVSQESQENDSSDEESEEESFYISDDPFEYIRYLGQWTDDAGKDAVLDITTKDDVNFSIEVTLYGKSDSWTGVFEKENGGIHYNGSLGGIGCEGYIRVDEKGVMKIKSVLGVSGKGLVMRRTDT